MIGVRRGSGTFRDVFTTFVLLWKHPAFFFRKKTHFPIVWTWPFVSTSVCLSKILKQVTHLQFLSASKAPLGSHVWSNTADHIASALARRIAIGARSLLYNLVSSACLGGPRHFFHFYVFSNFQYIWVLGRICISDA